MSRVKRSCVSLFIRKRLLSRWRLRPFLPCRLEAVVDDAEELLNLSGFLDQVSEQVLSLVEYGICLVWACWVSEVRSYGLWQLSGPRVKPCWRYRRYPRNYVFRRGWSRSVVPVDRRYSVCPSSFYWWRALAALWFRHMEYDGGKSVKRRFDHCWTCWLVVTVFTRGWGCFFGCLGFRGGFCFAAGGGLLSRCFVTSGSSWGSVTRACRSSCWSCSSRRTWYKTEVKMLATKVGEESNWLDDDPNCVSNALTRSKRLAGMCEA